MPLSASNSAYPPNTWLQVGPVLVAIPLAWWALGRWAMSTRGVACVAAFLLLHLLAAHWTYSDVPYDLWSRAVMPGGVDAAFGWRRNMFDRLVHFSFGLLAMTLLAELFVHGAGDGARRSMIEALGVVLALSAVYEIFEWLLAVTMDPADAAAYNGQQGDMFDSCKDMAMAATGSLVWIVARVARSVR